MAADLRACIARVFGTRDEVVGAAWLCGPKHLVSCAHVVARALGIPTDSLTTPSNARVAVDLPLLNPGKRFETVIEHWLPMRANEGPELLIDDIAGLRVVDDVD